jgi:SAM-dependent methyltransferase
MHETTKALDRRLAIPAFRDVYFVGSAIDVGAGPDGLSLQRDNWPGLTDVRDYDLEDGDAQMLENVPTDQYDVLHSSHCLEHMRDPSTALQHWVRVVKPGGYVVLLVPDEDMYEQGIFPSTFNPDHKVTFTPWKLKSWSAASISIPALLFPLGDAVEVLKIEQLRDGYDWMAPRHDQTATTDSVPCAIEILLRKRHPIEVLFGGRVGAARN